MVSLTRPGVQKTTAALHTPFSCSPDHWLLATYVTPSAFSPPPPPPPLYSYLADTDSLSESDCEDLEEDMQFDFAT